MIEDNLTVSTEICQEVRVEMMEAETWRWWAKRLNEASTELVLGSTHVARRWPGELR
jgi:hypothetical protein